MTEIRVGTPDTSQASSYRANIQLQGFAAGRADADGAGEGTGGVRAPTRAKDPGAGAYPETSARIHSSSVRSEPDLDALMPLPAGSYSAHAQYNSPGLSSRSRSGRDGAGAGARGRGRVAAAEEDSDGSSDGEVDVERSLLHSPTSPRSIGFTNVEHPYVGHDIYGDDLTAKALESCKKTVLHPYLGLMKVIGWRKISLRCYDLQQPKWLAVFNVLWPTFVCLLIVASCVTQIIACFRRDAIPITSKSVMPALNISPYAIPVGPTTFNITHRFEIVCEKHILTTFIIPDILLFLSFAYGLYIFRWVQTEQLSTLTETVFLGHISRHGRYSHRRLTCTLQLLIILGVVWVAFSMATSALRAYTLHLLDSNIHIEWLSNLIQIHHSSDVVVRWILVVITILGFIVLDIAYTAVVVNYCIQCQLLVYLLRSISERIKAKDWEIDQSIREIRTGREFLAAFNSHMARAMSLLLFIFVTSSIEAVNGLRSLSAANTPHFLVAILGFLTAVQWTSIFVVPVVQAARVTRSCVRLKKAASEVRARPYSYNDTPQLDLDSLVIFTSSLNMSAKLISVPVTPAIVALFFFVIGLILFLVFQYDNYSWASWL